MQDRAGPAPCRWCVHMRRARLRRAPRWRGKGVSWKDLAGDDDEDAAGSVFDEGFGQRAAPPSRRPAVEVLVAERDLVHGVADENLPAHRVAGLRQALQAVLEDLLVALLFLFLALGIVDSALA